MLKTVRPEEVGLSSANILKYLKMLDARGLAMHSVLIARGDEICTECYWEPFEKDTLHPVQTHSVSMCDDGDNVFDFHRFHNLSKRTGFALAM